MIANKPSLLVYNSNLKPDEEILAEFVVRQDVYEELFEAIQSASMQTPEQHYLIVGQRGMGKTTLINRLRLGIEQDPTLNQWLMPVVLQEEQYQITELANLWEVVADYLEGIDEQAFAGLFDKMEENYKRSDYERFCFDLLSDRLHKANKKIVLFIENFGEFLNKLSDIEQHRLREVLMMNNQIRLVGTSSVFLETEKKRTYGQTNVEQNFGYDKPFWEFFRTIALEGLSKTEAQTLLRNLAERYDKTEFLERILTNSPSRVEVLRRLSGGVVRTMVLLFEIFLDDENGSALSDLNLVLDRITPLYKHRTDDLSVQQQKIIDTIARHWDSISTKEIAERTRLESKLVSAQLKQLSQNHLIETIPTSTKNHLYQLSERFYNIWYLMRYGKRKDGSRVIWLVRFLEDWCDKGELNTRAKQYIQSLTRNKIKGEDALFWAEVYLNMPTVGRHTKLQLYRIVSFKFNEKDIVHLSKTDEGLYLKAQDLRRKNKNKEAIELLLKVKKPDFSVFNEIMLVYVYGLKKYEEAKKYLLNITTKGKDSELLVYWRLIYDLYINVKYLSEEEAITYFNKWRLFSTEKSGKFDYLFLSKINPEKALAIWDTIVKKDKWYKDFYFGYFLLNQNSIEESVKNVRQAFSSGIPEDVNIRLEYIPEYFEELLQKKQYHAIHQLFEDFEDLKEQFSPIWYALMVLMKDEFPDEHLRMPAELRETVDEIVEKVTNSTI